MLKLSNLTMETSSGEGGNRSNNASIFSYNNVTEIDFSGLDTVQRPGLWYLHLYLTPVIIAVGFLGNGLSFVVFVKTRLRHLSSSVYLAALCVADTLFLTQLGAMWLIYVRVFIYHKEGFCQTFVYISYVSAFLSVWFVVSFTVERYIVCIHPLRKQSICRVYRARVIVVIITIIAAVLYNFGAWTSGTVPYKTSRVCIPLIRFRSITSFLNNIDTVITLIIPSLLITCMNLRIVLRLSKLSSTRSKLIGNPCRPHLERLHSNTSQMSLSHIHQKTMIQKSQVKITKMLVSVSSIFVILNLPSHVIRVYITVVDLFNPGLNYDPSPPVALTQQALYFMYYTNFAINFFLYSLCGQNFRTALAAMFSKDRTKVKRKSSRFLSLRSTEALELNTGVFDINTERRIPFKTS